MEFVDSRDQVHALKYSLEVKWDGRRSVGGAVTVEISDTVTKRQIFLIKFLSL